MTKLAAQWVCLHCYLAVSKLPGHRLEWDTSIVLHSRYLTKTSHRPAQAMGSVRKRIQTSNCSSGSSVGWHPPFAAFIQTTAATIQICSSKPELMNDE